MRMLICAMWSLTLLATAGCAANVYRQERVVLDQHAQKFQTFLSREQVEAAVHENQAIELIGLRVKAGRIAGEDIRTARDLDEQGHLLDAVHERAALNWISLAQYFSTRQRYGAARALYQRVIQGAGKGGDRLYAEYAQQALADLDILMVGQGLDESVTGRHVSGIQRAEAGR